MSVSARKVEHTDDVFEGTGGEYLIHEEPDALGRVADWIWLCVPGCGPVHLPIGDRHRFSHHRYAWGWDGNHDAPTLTPSIATQVGHDGPRWHGHLVEGVLIPC